MRRGVISYLVFIVLIISSVYASSVIHASEPTREPILRIETGMHTAPIRRIAIDGENRFLVTGSNDKTVRVWELSTGRLIKVLRPPVDKGKEGRIYAVAISPDGRTIACGGWTGGDWEGAHSIYLFNRDDGRLIKRIEGLPNVINHLTYSRDGRFLVASLGGNNGIRVYRTSDYSLIAEDRNYGDSSYGADFSKDGRLVTTSDDGYVRLYDNNFKLIAKKKMRGGKKPYHVSFSPDGSLIAVGFNESTKVNVVSGRDLSYLYSPDTTGVKNGDLSSVSWSSDGESLYAGGRWEKEGKSPIRRWANKGRGGYKDIGVSDNTIMHILPLKDGGIVFGAGDPAFGILSPVDKLTLFKQSFIADYRGNWEGFLVSYDGSKVIFGYEVWGKSPAVFSVSERLLDIEPSDKTGLEPPILTAPGLDITDWLATYNPKLNGKNLRLEPYEPARSLAISPDGKRFLLGTEWYLRCFDRDGNEIWSVPAPGVAWAVNISGNCRVAVAAFADGTIRWYRMKDGEELLALFPHRDRKRWVLWSPTGYYDASAGGDSLIGWHINNGKDREADFFPVSRFRDRFYRPDIIAKLLTTYDEKEAIRLASEESGRKPALTSISESLPPVITILSPVDGSRISERELTVRYSVKTPQDAPLTAIKVLIDGRPESTKRGIEIKPKDGSAQDIITIKAPERDFELSLIGENKYGASGPSTVRLIWAGKKEEYIIKPKLYVLAIGISNYKDPSLRLQFAHKDAQEFVKVLESQKGRLYEDIKVKLLTNDMATKDEILDGLEWLQRQTTHKDVAMLFIAGHGINDPAGLYYFLPHNADLEKLKRTGVPFSDIKNTVSSIAGKVVMFVDTCHSGGVMGKRSAPDITGVINELTSAENGVVVFASSTGRQYSLEDPQWGHGAFTKALIEGLEGKADILGKGKITVNMLDAYVAERVKELTKGKQTPVTAKPETIPDFPVAIK